MWDRERFVVVLLNNQNRIIGFDEVAVGGPAISHVSCRDIMKSVVLANAVAFVCFHNHPEGSAEPSPGDYRVTQRLKEVSQLLGVQMLDHLIFGENGYYSFADEGRL